MTGTPVVATAGVPFQRLNDFQVCVFTHSSVSGLFMCFCVCDWERSLSECKNLVNLKAL